VLGLPVDGETGHCIYLKDDNTCEKYESRPDFCRINRMYRKSGFDKQMSFGAYLQYNASICNSWVAEDRMPDGYLVRMGE
jgi:Fe-S-cluster containining protein